MIRLIIIWFKKKWHICQKKKATDSISSLFSRVFFSYLDWDEKVMLFVRASPELEILTSQCPCKSFNSEESSENLNIVVVVVVFVTVVMVVLTHNQKQGTVVERLLLEIHSVVAVAVVVSWQRKRFLMLSPLKSGGKKGQVKQSNGPF